FIVVPMAVLAAAGWDLVFRQVAPKTMVFAVAAFVVMIAEPFLFQIRNHPNQAVYFTPMAGGPRGAFGRYDMDYWGNCILEATGWAAAKAERAGMALGVASNAWEILAMDTGRFKRLYFRQQRHPGWHFNVVLLKGSSEHITAVAADPAALYRVQTS